MTEKELREQVTEILWRAHYLTQEFVFGKEYVENELNLVWIRWEFDREIQRMTEKEWEKVTETYIKALRGE